MVMVTDGICRMDEKFVSDLLEAKKEMDFRIWSILIGNDSSGELKRYSDEVWASNRLTEDVAGEVFERAH